MIRPSTPSWVSTRGETETLAAYFFPADSWSRPSSSGSASRIAWAPRSWPSASSASTAAQARSIQAAPSSAIPWVSISLASRGRSWAATRADALPHAAGSRSRGNTKTVRRMASCLTIVRRSYSSRSMSSTPTSSTRANRERYTVAGSVACRTVIASVAATGSAYRFSGWIPWRTAMRARRSSSVT